MGLAPFAPTKDERDYSRATREVCFWLSPRCAREACLVRALKSEGHGAPRGANVLSRFLGEKEAHRLAALHCGILGEGSVLPGQDKRDTRLDPAGFRLPSSCPRPALDEQSHVVGPDADPSLPDDMAANHARGHRILLRFMSALEKRPSRTGHAELKRGLERGDSYPHHELLRAPLFIPGRAFSREPGIHGPVLRCSRFMPPWLSSLPGPEIRSA